ncbi:MAG: polymer-forming cytoskeletal protein [Halobacteriaceae archaeon]
MVARRLLPLTVALALLALVVAPGVAAAAETRSGGNVVVGPNETVDGDLTVYGGNVEIRGTVNGDVEAFGGNVALAQSGTVTGDLRAYAGNVEVRGRVGGDVEASAGTVSLGPGSTVGGSLSAAGGTVTLAGTVAGDAEVGAETLTVAESGVVRGNLRYDAGTFTNQGTVQGTVTPNADVAVGGGPQAGLPRIPGWAFAVYAVLANLVFGAILLAAAPRFTGDVADRVADSPLTAGGVGLLVVVGVPVALVVLLVTIVGIPLALVGLLLFALLAWVAVVLGRFAVGSWLLSLVDVDNRWAALVVGLVVVPLVARIPWVGGLLDFLVTLLGFGAVALALRAVWRRRRDDGATADGSGGDFAGP